MAYVNAACARHVTIFSTGSKFRPVSNFTKLHALTLAARSYVLLLNQWMRPSYILGILLYRYLSMYWESWECALVTCSGWSGDVTPVSFWDQVEWNWNIPPTWAPVTSTEYTLEIVSCKLWASSMITIFPFSLTPTASLVGAWRRVL